MAWQPPGNSLDKMDRPRLLNCGDTLQLTCPPSQKHGVFKIANGGWRWWGGLIGCNEGGRGGAVPAPLTAGVRDWRERQRGLCVGADPGTLMVSKAAGSEIQSPCAKALHVLAPCLYPPGGQQRNAAHLSRCRVRCPRPLQADRV